MKYGETTKELFPDSKYRFNSTPIRDYYISFSGTKLDEVIDFQKQLEDETKKRMPEFLKVLNSFFGIDPNFGFSTLPSVYISDTVYGGSGRWSPGRNTIELPIKLSLPFFLDEVKNIEDAPHWPTFGHELAHSLLMALLTNERIDDYLDKQIKTSPVIQEFFARLGERATCEAMSICLPPANPEEFRTVDPHRVFALADELFEEISKKTSQERAALLTDISSLKRIVQEYQDIYAKANQEAWNKRQKRR